MALIGIAICLMYQRSQTMALMLSVRSQTMALMLSVLVAAAWPGSGGQAP